MTELEPKQPSGVSRRTVTKAMAWAIPAIAVAAPVPAFAGASQGTIAFTGANCKLPGDSAVDPYKNGAIYTMTVTNTTAVAVTVCITGVARTGQSFTSSDITVVRLSGTGTKCTNLGACFTVNANSSDTYALVTKEWSNSANGSLSVTYTVGGVPVAPATSPSNDLSPITSNPSCGIGGSCTSISTAYKQCILKALGQATCPGL